MLRILLDPLANIFLKSLSPSINLVSDITSCHTLSILHQNIKCWGSMVETWLKTCFPVSIFFVSVSITYTPLSSLVRLGGSLGWVGLVLGGPLPPLVLGGCAPLCLEERQFLTSEGGSAKKQLLHFVSRESLGAKTSVKDFCFGSGYPQRPAGAFRPGPSLVGCCEKPPRRSMVGRLVRDSHLYPGRSFRLRETSCS